MSATGSFGKRELCGSATNNDTRCESTVMHAKDYRPAGQGWKAQKAQLVVVTGVECFDIWGDLPRIAGQLPKIADVFRTTPDEKGLTLGHLG